MPQHVSEGSLGWEFLFGEGLWMSCSVSDLCKTPPLGLNPCSQASPWMEHKGLTALSLTPSCHIFALAVASLHSLRIVLCVKVVSGRKQQ